jgi:tetratricopeptide (TPR) repeat protein
MAAIPFKSISSFSVTCVIQYSLFVVLFALSFSSSAQLLSRPMDQLFVDLKNAPDQAQADKIENKIWEEWIKSGDPKVDEMLRAAMRMRDEQDFDGSIAMLDKIIELKPDFPEAWNQRGLVYFHKKDYEQSLINIAKVLELEPRHFGAMSGRAVIRLYQSKPALGRQNMIEALKIHPYLKAKSLFPGL